MKNCILSRRGSTMVELLIAMALIAIVSVMIVSFSAMAHSFAGDEQGKHSFLDEAAAIRADINDYLMKHDIDEQIVKCIGNGLVCAESGESVSWYSSQETFNGKVYDNVVNVVFDVGSNSSLLKCTVTGSTEKGVEYKQTFVFALRCATFTKWGGQ